MYTDDLNTQKLSSRIGFHTAGEHANHIAYAGDMGLLEHMIQAFRTLIDICFKITGKNGMLHNETKTKCVTFWPRLYTQLVLPKLSLGTASLKFVDETVYLGHFIISNLKDDSDAYKQVKKLNMIQNVLIRKLASCY